MAFASTPLFEPFSIPLLLEKLSSSLPLAKVKLIKCLVDNIVIDISFNQLGGLSTLCFLEQKCKTEFTEGRRLLNRCDVKQHSRMNATESQPLVEANVPEKQTEIDWP